MTRTTILTRSDGTVGLRSAGELGLATASVAAGAMPFVAGRFSHFNEWALVASTVEGRFMEMISAGAFTRTLKEDRQHIKILFDHGQDPFIGARPLAPLEGIGEDDVGAWYFGRMFDTLAARELRPLLEGGVLGSSFRFKVDRGKVEDWPARSERNPERLPEHTILAATLIEVGPCTFPVYRSATAGTATGAHPPRSSTPAMSRDAFLRRLATPPSDTPAARAARKRWLDKLYGPGQ